MEPALLACDWGTTNLRAWSLDGAGQVLADRDFPLGVSRLAPGEAARRFREEVRPAMAAPHAPALLCGMVGSNLGWTSAPYLACPAGPEDLARALLATDPAPSPAWIVPGLRGDGLAGAPDVMRGEETQLFGWMALDPDGLRGRRLLCHPGTHAKWVVAEDGRIVRFTTFMSGELFAVLRSHSVLKTDAAPDDEAAFDQGVAAAGDGGALAARLFSARSRVVAGGASPDGAASYLSGLIIGAEVAAAAKLFDLTGGQGVDVIGDPALCRWYARALAAAGIGHQTHDGEAAAIAGLLAVARAGGLL